MVIPLPREDCLRVTHPCATLLGVAPFLVRLACVKRAANVRSEPGSNSPVKTVSIDPDGRNHQRISFGCQLRRAGETRPFANGLCLRFSFQRPMPEVSRPGPVNLVHLVSAVKKKRTLFSRASLGRGRCLSGRQPQPGRRNLLRELRASSAFGT